MRAADNSLRYVCPESISCRRCERAKTRYVFIRINSFLLLICVMEIVLDGTRNGFCDMRAEEEVSDVMMAR